MGTPSPIVNKDLVVTLYDLHLNACDYLIDFFLTRLQVPSRQEPNLLADCSVPNTYQ